MTKQDDELVARLRERRSFWLNGAAWMMGTNPDSDCTEAADRIAAQAQLIEEQRKEIAELRAIIATHGATP